MSDSINIITYDTKNKDLVNISSLPGLYFLKYTKNLYNSR